MPDPTVAISMGDPGGVGPEVILKALSELPPTSRFRPVIIGAPEFFRGFADTLNLSLPMREFASWEDAVAAPIGVIPVLAPPECVGGCDHALGGISASNGRMAYSCIRMAAQLALSGKADAICTAPISSRSARRVRVSR